MGRSRDLMMRSSAAAALALALVGASACGPDDAGDANAPDGSEDTAQATGQAEQTAQTAQPAKPAAEPTPAPLAPVRRLLPGESSPGPNARAKAGDVVLRSADGVSFAVRDPAAGEGLQVLDVWPEGSGDQLGAISTWLGGSTLEGLTAELVEMDEDSLVSRTRSDQLSIESKWTVLPSADPAVAGRLVIHTTIVNQGTADLFALEVGDRLRWGSLAPFAPGAGGRTPAPNAELGWLGAMGDDYAAILVAAGPRQLRTAPGGALAIRRLDLPAGGRAVVERELLVGRDLASLAPAAALVRGEEVVPVHVRARQARATSDLAGVTVTVLRRGSMGSDPASWPEVVVGTTALDGSLSTVLAPGSYRIIGSMRSRRSAAASDLEIVAGSPPVTTTVLVSGPGALELAPVDAAGAPVLTRFRIEGVGDSRDPDLSYLGAAAFENTAYVSEPITVPLPPGTYRVTGGRGFDWTPVRETVQVPNLAAGLPTPKLAPRLEHSLKTPGWRRCDLGRRSTGEDADASAELGVQALLGGVDCLTTDDPGLAERWAERQRAVGVTGDLLGLAWPPGGSSVSRFAVLGSGRCADDDERVRDWLRLLVAGARPLAVAAARRDEAVGSVVTFVPGGGEGTADAVTKSLTESGRATASNGPFLDIALAGPVRNNQVPLLVTMHAPAWMGVERVELWSQDPVIDAPWSPGSWAPGAPGVEVSRDGELVTWTVQAQLPVEAVGDWVVAIARGDRATTPSGCPPVALTNPLDVR